MKKTPNRNALCLCAPLLAAIAPGVAVAGEEILRTNKALTEYRTKYLDAEDNKAFAQSPGGAYSWRAERTSPQFAREDALRSCNETLRPGEARCLVVNVNGAWLGFGDASPVENSSDERKKASVVSRLYQITYGANERCKFAKPDAASTFQAEFTRFFTTYENLRKLLADSPHFVKARESRSSMAVINPERDTPQSLADECKYLASVLGAMIDQEEGKKAVSEYVAVLAK